LRSCKIIEYAEAKQIVDALVAEISKAGGAGVIAVVDPAGELIAFARMDGAPPSSIRIAANKAYSAARERKTTEEIGKKARHPEKGFEMAWFGDDRFVGWGGGVPVWRGGEVVGAIALSGLPQAEDIRLANWAATLVAGSE
jgi:glc operon protein GlcG